MRRIIVLITVFVLVFSFTALADDVMETVEIEINTVGASGGKIYWGDKNFTTTTGYVSESGTELELEARETTGKFLYWKDVETGKVISRDMLYTFRAMTKVNIQAMFAHNTILATRGYVTFIDKDGTILSASYVSGGSSAEEPTTLLLKSAGYTFVGWDTDEWQEVEAGQIILATAVYEKKEDLFGVTVTGGTTVPAQDVYEYDTHVTVFPDLSRVPEGMYFAGWKMNGIQVTTEEIFSFFVGADTELEPVYSETEPELKPICEIIDINDSVINNRVSVLVSRTMPEGYTLIESGIIYLDGSSSGSLVYGGKSVKRIFAQSPYSSGFFRYNFSTLSGLSKRIRPYIIYSSEDVIYVCYGEEQTITG